MLGLARACLTLIALATFAANGWLLAQHPFARPMVERSAEQVRLGLAAAVAREVNPEWLAPRLEAALSERDLDDAELLERIAGKHGIALSPAHAERLARLRDDLGGLRVQTACALDPADCATIRQMVVWNLPVELTPAGDLNALRRGLQAHLAGEGIDELEISLAAVGLAATALVIAGPAGPAVKAGSTFLRVARRAGRMSAAMGENLSGLARGVIRWESAGRFLRTGRIEDLVDTARAGKLAGLLPELARIVRNSSSVDAIALVRHVDSPDELARLARLSDAAGAETRESLRVLGKARAFRMMTRLADIALLAAGLLALMVAQILSFLVFLLRRMLPRVPRGPLAGARAGASVAHAMAAGGQVRAPRP